jgi:hypothetical protein
MSTENVKTEIVKVGSDEIEAVRGKDGQGWVVVHKVCEVLGVDANGQTQRLKKLTWPTTCVLHVVANDGRVREHFCLSTESTPMWLATIQTSRVNPKVKSKLVQFQKLAAKALADWAYGRNNGAGSSFKGDAIAETLAGLTKVIVELNNNVLALRSPVISTTETPKKLAPRDSNEDDGEEVNLVDLSPGDIRKLLNRMVRRSVDYGFESEYRAAWDKLYRLYSRASGVDVANEAFEAGVLRGKEVKTLDWVAKYGHLYHLYRYAKVVLKPGRPRELRKVRSQAIEPEDVVELSGITDFESIWDT